MMMISRTSTNSSCIEPIPVAASASDSITEYSLRLREQVHSGSIQSIPNSTPTSPENILNQISGQNSRVNDTSFLIDMFSMACDVGFLSYYCSGSSYKAFRDDCSIRYSLIVGTLNELKFSHYLSEIQIWEESRIQNTQIFSFCIHRKELLSFLGVSHSCVHCIQLLKPCQHICCKEWYERAGKSCGFFIATKGNNPPNTEDMGSEILRNENTSKRQKEDEECSFEHPVKRSKHSCMLSMKTPGKQSSHRSLGAKAKKNGKHKSSIMLRATTTFPEQLFFMSPTSNLAVLSTQRLASLVCGLMQQNIPEQIVTCARESLQLWSQLSSSEKTNLSTNIRYAACVIGQKMFRIISTYYMVAISRSVKSMWFVCFE